ncbi:MAG: transglycosylase SLT domain-containing protein [Blastocatellia bacterium]
MLKVAVWLLAILGAGAGVVTPPDHLLSKIEEGRELLKTESVQMITGTVGTRRVRVGRRQYKEVPITGIIGREMALAILDADGSIRLARAIKRDPGFEVLSPDFILSMRRENGINSDIAVISPAGGKVVAVKYPVSNESNRFGPGDSVIQAVYTPYSAEIKTEDVVKKGIDVKNGFIEKAYSRLRARGVLSRAFPGRRVVDVIPKDVLRVLLLNEHIDPGEFKSAGLTKPLAERVLTVIGTNREKAYAYSISSAGARGLVQMIPSTYTLLMNRYSAAGLKADFHSAMADPINAVMAQVLLCDSDWESIRARTDMPAERVGPYLAAAYNGGVGRVLSVLSNEQTDWMEDPDSNSRPTRTVSKKVPVRIRTRSGRVAKRYVVKRYTQPIFKNETSKYVAQYHWISDYLAERSKPGTPPRNVEAR